MDEDLKDYTDEELVRAWNHLETCKETPDLIRRVKAIDAECTKRRIIAWNHKGEITVRE